MSERCVCCGEAIPEGRQVCPACEKGTKREGETDDDERHVCQQHVRVGDGGK